MWRLNIGLSGATVLVALYWLGSLAWHGNDIADHPVWLVLTACPPLWLFAAAVLSRADQTPSRYGLTVAGTVSLLLYAHRLTMWLDVDHYLPGWIELVTFTARLEHAPAVLAMTTIVPAIVGWWQRRRDRLAAEEAE